MPVIPIRTENATLLYAEVDAPANFLRVRAASVGFAALAAVILTAYMWLVWRMRRRLSDRPKTHVMQTLREILLTLLASILLNVVNVFMYSVQMPWRTCLVVSTFPGALYSLSRFFCYRTLLLRARTVECIMPEWYLKLLWLTKLAVFGTIPFLIVTVITSKARVVFAESFCTVELDGVIPTLAAVLDALLSCQLVMLFVLPVLKQSMFHARETSGKAAASGSSGGGGGESSQQRLKRAAVRNFVLSLVAILSSAAFLTSLVICFGRASSASASIYNQHLRISPCYGAATDTLINATALLAIYEKLIFPRREKRQAKTRPAVVAAASFQSASAAAAAHGSATANSIPTVTAGAETAPWEPSEVEPESRGDQ